MKILVYAHQLEIGGTQVNAIELASALRDLHKHEVVLFATPGPMIKYAEKKRIKVLKAPTPKVHPSPARMRALRDAIRKEKPDIIHIWDWWQCLDAYYAAHLPMQIPIVVTDMNMYLSRLLPKRISTTFGTPELVECAKANGWKRAYLLLPPIDTDANSDTAVDSGAFRDQLKIKDGDIVIVTVSRLSNSLKGESLFRTMEAVRALRRAFPLRFILVGDGVARERLQVLANDINTTIKREAVQLLGAMIDPRPAYAVADVVIGMGGSALRGMAFGKPVIIVGERNFSAPFNSDTFENFYYKGMYGLGDGSYKNDRLIYDVKNLVEQYKDFSAIGAFSRNFVEKYYSIVNVSSNLNEILRKTANEKQRTSDAIYDGIRTAAVCIKERNFLPDGHFLKFRIRKQKIR